MREKERMGIGYMEHERERERARQLCARCQRSILFGARARARLLNETGAPFAGGVREGVGE